MGPTLPSPAGRNRKWQELPEELTTSFLERVDTLYKIVTARKVCKSWRQILSRPEMWRIVDLRFSGPGYEKENDLLVNKMARNAVDWSSGQLIEFRLGYYGDDSLLNYISERYILRYTLVYFRVDVIR